MLSLTSIDKTIIFVDYRENGHSTNKISTDIQLIKITIHTVKQSEITENFRGAFTNLRDDSLCIGFASKWYKY